MQTLAVRAAVSFALSTAAAFPGLYEPGFWTASPLWGDASSAWLVDTYYGWVGTVDAGKAEKARCVRGSEQVAQAQPRYVISESGLSAVDLWTKLQWQRGTAVGNKTWQFAQQYCNSLTLDGKNGWRLPSVRELQSITDPKKAAPAIDMAVFPDTKPLAYWSSTVRVGTFNGWMVNFLTGGEGFGVSTVAYPVRCVRGL
jgi:hypothetical protein